MLKQKLLLQRFITPQEGYYGKDCIKGIRAIKSVRSLIIVPKVIYDLNLFNIFLSHIKAQETCVIVSPFQFEPTIQEVRDVLGKVEKFQPDTIFALGGGSIIDGAKLIAFFMENWDSLDKNFESLGRKGNIKYIDIYAIPTTCGTGSEVSSSAILSRNGKKFPFVNTDFLPKAFFLDPSFLETLPPSIIAEGAIDAMTHSIEGFLSPITNPLMDSFAITSVQLLRKNLFETLKHSSDKDRILNLQIGALLAGYVQNHCLVGLTHSISHALSKFNISHGLINLLVLKEVLVFNLTDNNTKNKLQGFIDSSGFLSISDFFNFLQEIKNVRKIELKELLTKEDLSDESLIQDILEDPLTKFNPVSPNKTDLFNILMRSYEV